MLKPLKAAITSAIGEKKEQSWFPALSMFTVIISGIFYNLFNLKSMRDTIDKINNCEELAIGHVAVSTFSDALNSRRRLQVLQKVFINLLLWFPDKVPRKLKNFRHVVAIDSTIIHNVLSAVWAKYRKNVNAVKAHVAFDLSKCIPKAFVISAAKVHDRKCFEVFFENGWTYVVDRAYNDYSLFDRMIEMGVFFVTKLKKDASLQIIKKKRAKRSHRKKGVVSDTIIRLGNGSNEMVHYLRLVVFETEDGKVYHFLTNRFDLAPTSVATLYEARWAIEIFFKHLKRTLKGARLLARSEVGAEIHVFLALITDLLLKCLSNAIGCWEKVKRHVPVNFLRVVRDCLFNTFTKQLQIQLIEAFP